MGCPYQPLLPSNINEKRSIYTSNRAKICLHQKKSGTLAFEIGQFKLTKKGQKLIYQTGS